MTIVENSTMVKEGEVTVGKAAARLGVGRDLVIWARALRTCPKEDMEKALAGQMRGGALCIGI